MEWPCWGRFLEEVLEQGQQILWLALLYQCAHKWHNDSIFIKLLKKWLPQVTTDFLNCCETPMDDPQSALYWSGTFGHIGTELWGVEGSCWWWSWWPGVVLYGDELHDPATRTVRFESTRRAMDLISPGSEWGLSRDGKLPRLLENEVKGSECKLSVYIDR